MSSLFRPKVQNPEQKNILSHVRSIIDHDDGVVRSTGGPIVGRRPIGIQPRKIRRIRRAGIFCVHADRLAWSIKNIHGTPRCDEHAEYVSS
jgi:hypothetical protein